MKRPPAGPTRQARRKAVRAAGPINRPPSYRESAPGPLVLRERPVPLELSRALVNAENAYLRFYSLGECSVIVTRERGRWHLSVSHPKRLPSWPEVAEARYLLIPNGVVCAMILPPKSAYVNVDEHCLQVFEIDDPNPEFRP